MANILLFFGSALPYPFKNKLLFVFGLYFFFLLFPTYSMAQQATPLVNSTLEGVVLDAATREPLAGVTLQLEGVTHSTKTDERGRFRFVTGQKFPYAIIVSYIGYKTRTVTADKSPVTIELEQVITDLDEVVVIGYGEQTRRDFIGSVAQVTGDQI